MFEKILDNEQMFWYNINTNKVLVLLEVMIMSKKRIMKRRRFVTVSVLVLLMISTMLNFALAKSDTKNNISVIVKSGESIWSIACKNNPNEKDIRKLVHEIIEENNLRNSTVYAGQEIVIPIN